MNRAFFLDRDGVLNVEVNYLGDPKKMCLLPRAAEAVKLIHQAGFMAIVITNQGGVAKQLFTEKNVNEVHARMQRDLLVSGSDAVLDAFYYCVHHPEVTGPCRCRKPQPYMLEKAADDFDIDLKNSFMLGDRMSDLFTGRNAGCADSCLVLTGYGEKDKANAVAEKFSVAEDIFEAVKLLLDRQCK